MDSLMSVWLPLIQVQPFLPTLLYIACALIVSIALMNLVTAVLVEKAIEHTQMDSDTERQLRRQKLNTLRPAIHQVFSKLDVDGSGALTKKQVIAAVTRKG